MNLRDWYRNLAPKRKFAIKSVTKIAAVSVPVIGDQLHTLFETAFEDLQEHEESSDLIEFTKLVNDRFDRLITQVGLRASTYQQIEALISRYLQANLEALQADLRVIDQHATRVQESLNRLHSSLTRVEEKIDDMGSQLDAIFADIQRMEEIERQDREHNSKVQAWRDQREKRSLVGTNQIISLDFSSTHMNVACSLNKKTYIVPLGTSTDHLPTCLSWGDRGELFIGSRAEKRRVSHPNSTIHGTLLFRALYGPNTLEGLEAERRSGLVQLHDNQLYFCINGELFQPVEIAAKLIREAKERAEDHLRFGIESIVISTHATASRRDRFIVRTACRLAGLDVKRIISQSAAWTMKYGYDNMVNVDGELIAICRIGADSFDVQIIEVSNDVIEVVSASGGRTVSGARIDQLLVNHFLEVFSKQTGIELTDLQALARLREAAEKSKIRLSNENEVTIELPFLYVDESKAHHLSYRLTRAEFESLIEPMIETLYKSWNTSLCHKTADGFRKITTAEINKVFVAGDASQVPIIQRNLIKYFGQPLVSTLNDFESTVTGLALQAGIISGDVKDLLLLDVTPHSIGIEIVGGDMMTLISKSTTIPTKKSEVLSITEDYQIKVKSEEINNQSEASADNDTIRGVATIKVYEGDLPIAFDNQYLGSLDIKDVLPISEEIEVMIDIDADSRLRIRGLNKASGLSNQLIIPESWELSDSQLQHMRARLALDYRPYS